MSGMKLAKANDLLPRNLFVELATFDAVRTHKTIYEQFVEVWR